MAATHIQSCNGSSTESVRSSWDEEVDEEWEIIGDVFSFLHLHSFPSLIKLTRLYTVGYGINIPRGVGFEINKWYGRTSMNTRQSMRWRYCMLLEDREQENKNMIIMEWISKDKLTLRSYAGLEHQRHILL